MTPDFVSEYATLTGMVKACQRFIMALADVIFDATTRLRRDVLFLCVIVYTISLGRNVNSALFLEVD